MPDNKLDKLEELAGELPPYGFLFNSWRKSDAAKLMCDATMTMLAVNDELGFMFDYHPNDLVNKPVHMLLPTSLQEIHERVHTAGYVERPRDRPMGAGGELKGRRADGTEFPVVIHLIRYRDKLKGLLFEATVRHPDTKVNGA